MNVTGQRQALGFLVMIFILGCATTSKPPSSNLSSAKTGSSPVQPSGQPKKNQLSAVPTVRQAIMRAYLQNVEKYDGVDEKEAVLLAQSQLIFQGYADSYDVETPQVVSRDDKFWKIQFSPVSKNTMETDASPLMISVNRKDGVSRLEKIK